MKIKYMLEPVRNSRVLSWCWNSEKRLEFWEGGPKAYLFFYRQPFPRQGRQGCSRNGDEGTVIPSMLFFDVGLPGQWTRPESLQKGVT
jgi:hypothetical protein